MNPSYWKERSKITRSEGFLSTVEVRFSGETYHPLRIIDLRATMEKERRSKTVLMEYAIIKCRSPYNVIIGRTRMRSLRAVGSTIYSMIKFPTNQGIVAMETSRKALWECRQLEMVQGSWKEVQWRQCKQQMSRIREQVILRTKSSSGRGPNSSPVPLEKHRAGKTQRKYLPSAMNVQTNGRLVLKEKVFRWLKEGIIRKVQHPVWVTNMILVKLANGTWKVQVDYSSLNKVYAKDMYPFPEEGEELASLIGYPYKCFLRLPKQHSQIRMAEDDEEKTRFHMEEGVYCFTHMLKELKNSAATLQRMMEKVLADERGRNMEICLE
ncbi:hypothetical protein Tco_0133257 [Tanacetum coccineum]